MRSNQPQAKFRLKLDSNHLLIDFFAPKSESELLQRNRFQQLKKRSKSSKSINLNRKWLNLIKIESFLTLFDVNGLFQLNN